MKEFDSQSIETPSAARTSRFERYKQRHQNPSIAIPLAIMRCGLSPTALAWYLSLRATADWSTGILPPHATPHWLEKAFKVSRRQRLTREKELRAAGVFESNQRMAVRFIRGRKRLVKQERVARIFAEPQKSQNLNKNLSSFSVPFLSPLKNGTPNASSEGNSKALQSGKVNTKANFLPLDRVAPRSCELSPRENGKSRKSLSVPGPDLTTTLKTSQEANPPGKLKQAQDKTVSHPDLNLGTILDVRPGMFFLTRADEVGMAFAEKMWRSRGCPVECQKLIEVLEQIICEMTRQGIIYPAILLRRKRELQRRDFSPRLSFPRSQSVTQWTPPPGSCSKCGDQGLIVLPGGLGGRYCSCSAGHLLMFPVAANRHPGQVGYSLSPPQEVRDEKSSLRTDPGEESEGQTAHAATCAARERQRQPDLPFFRSVQGSVLYLEEAL